MEIKNEDRSMPNLIIIQIKKTKSIEFKRSSNKEFYSKRDWLYSCSNTKYIYFFCFPRLLFCHTSGDEV